MRLLPLPGVFQPPSDAWMLVARMSEEALGPGTRVLDLCTGSGILAIHAALSGAQATAVDVSRRAVLAVRLNARLNGVRVRARRGNLFEPVAGERFDLIVSNPPYLPSPQERLPDRGLDRATEAGPTGRVFVDRICARAAAHLQPGGRVLIVHSSLNSEAATIARLEAEGLEAEVVWRHRGPLGPILSARAGWLRAQGLLGAEAAEDIVIVRGRRALGPGSAESGSADDAAQPVTV